MNILLTNFCNRRCPYCFAKGKLVSERPMRESYLSLKNLEIILEFAKRSKQTKVGILGGEPTLHPEFEKVIATIIEQGLNVSVFSNGVIGQEMVTFFKGIDRNKWNMLLNMNAPGSYTEKEWFAINQTMRSLHRQVTVGFNIYQSDFNMDFLVMLIQKYHLQKRIRLAIALPIFGQNNQYVRIEDHPKISEKIVDFVDKYQTAGISLEFDCGFISCSFTDAQLGKLLRFGTGIRFECAPIIDVGPDLTLWHCFATSMIWNKKLTDFEDLDAARKFYDGKFKPFRRVGATDECFRCKHLKFGTCSGGCLAHTLKSFYFPSRKASNPN